MKALVIRLLLYIGRYGSYKMYLFWW